MRLSSLEAFIYEENDFKEIHCDGPTEKHGGGNTMTTMWILFFFYHGAALTFQCLRESINQNIVSCLVVCAF